LIHGWGGKASQYFAFVERLISGGIEVIGFDAPAHGRSSGEFASGPAFARAAIETVARVGPVSGLIAHSLGAAASAIAILEGLAVKKIVLLAPIARIFPRLEAFAERRQLTLAQTEALFAAFSAKYRHRILSVTEAVRDFAGEGLIFHDPDDPEVPFAQGAAIAAAWSNVQLIPISNVGHWRILRSREIVERAVTFLTR
jgi:pimeloyl-ACP methyl ester carboxylesterase